VKYGEQESYHRFLAIGEHDMDSLKNPTSCPPGCLLDHSHLSGVDVKVSQESIAPKKVLDFAKENMTLFQSQLEKLVRIPSVSSQESAQNQMEWSAEATAEALKEAGLSDVQILKIPNTHPYVYASWVHKSEAPTVLLYAHHDVQPEGRRARWRSDPYEPTVSQGRLYGRGTADDKAGIMAHVAAISSYLKTLGELPVNVKVLIEGEEEIGSPNLGNFVRQYASTLRADTMILTDCANVDSGVPSITTALRGLVSVDIELFALRQPVHSGLWGGILPDCSLALSLILSSLANSEGKILIPGIYDDVQTDLGIDLSSVSLHIAKSARDCTGLLPSLGFLSPQSQFAQNLWHQPSLSINGIQSGSREQASNVIQDSAWARVGIRIVPHMKPRKVMDLLKNHIRAMCPPGFELKITEEALGDWWKMSNPDDEVYQIAARSLAAGYGQPTQWIGCGASIPFVTPLVEELGGIPAILVGIEDPYTLAHSENESLNLSDFSKTIAGQIHMLSDLSRWRRK
jgi:acetylornithine deacetylase/succinyl-diaminopimelate desuccinylase-like protein